MGAQGAQGAYHHKTAVSETVRAVTGPEDGGTLVIPGSHKLDPSVDARARSHSHFVPPFVHFIPDSRTFTRYL
jgi:ectoine hydroxylase-related dioxygenase (phytanoyl-CoA dioxygenase family)